MTFPISTLSTPTKKYLTVSSNICIENLTYFKCNPYSDIYKENIISVMVADSIKQKSTYTRVY